MANAAGLAALAAAGLSAALALAVGGGEDIVEFARYGEVTLIGEWSDGTGEGSLTWETVKGGDERLEKFRVVFYKRIAPSTKSLGVTKLSDYVMPHGVKLWVYRFHSQMNHAEAQQFITECNLITEQYHGKDFVHEAFDSDADMEEWTDVEYKALKPSIIEFAKYGEVTLVAEWWDNIRYGRLTWETFTCGVERLEKFRAAQLSWLDSYLEPLGVKYVSQDQFPKLWVYRFVSQMNHAKAQQFITECKLFTKQYYNTDFNLDVDMEEWTVLGDLAASPPTTIPPSQDDFVAIADHSSDFVLTSDNEEELVDI